MSLRMSLTCSEGGKAGAVDGEAVHRLTTAATCAASCGGAQDQAAPSAASCVLNQHGLLQHVLPRSMMQLPLVFCSTLFSCAVYPHGGESWVAGGQAREHGRGQG